MNQAATVAQSPRPWRLAGRLLGAAALGCAPGGEQAASTLAPGDSLLDHVAEAVVTSRPASIVPQGVQAAEAASAPRAVRIARDEWRRVKQVAGKRAVPLANAGLVAWAPRDAIDRGDPTRLAAVWVGGRPLKRHVPGPGESAIGDASAWQSAARKISLWWMADGPVLLTPGEPAGMLALWEDGAAPRLAEPPPPGDDPEAWIGTVRLQGAHRQAPGRTDWSLPSTAGTGAHRRALRLGAPGRVAWSLPRLAAASLHLAVGVSDIGRRVEQGRVVRRARVGDGVTFRVEVDAGQGPAVAWQRHLAAGEGWVTARVDLSSWAGRDVRLMLVSDPGPQGDAFFDDAAWADLRLTDPAAPPASRPSVILIDIDTLRADRLGCYGNVRDTSPGLDAWVKRWAERGTVLFTDCLSPASWTLPSTMSLLTGLTPTQHGVDHASRALGDDIATVAGRLREAGYQTFALTEGGYTDPQFGFSAGFDTFVLRALHDFDWDPALRFIDDRAPERPFFVFLQSFAVHAPYLLDLRFEQEGAPYTGPLAGKPLSGSWLRRAGTELNAEDRAYLSRLYDAGIRRLDDDLAAFLQQIDQRLDPDEVLVVLTSDHGEEFAEHGSFGHGHSLHGELLRVPLIVRFPEPVPGAPPSSPLPVSLLDVVPTLLQAAGLQPPATLPGRSLHALLAGAAAGAPPPRPRVAWLDSRYRAVQQSGTKLILPGKNPLVADEVPLLYELTSDPREQSDRATQAPDRIAALRQLLEAFEASFPSLQSAAPAQIDDQTRQALRQLGYLGDN